MRRLILIVTVVFLAAAAGVMMPETAYAMDEPEGVSLYDIMIFHDLLYEDDFTAIVPYHISFETTPDDAINQTFIFSVLSENGTTQLGAVTAHPRYYGGYGKGVVMFYLQSGMVWNRPYIFRVQQNPVYYPSPQKWDFTIGTNQYSTDADQSQGLRAKIIDSATELSTEWNVDLLSSGDSGQTVLSTYGELYYLNAVPGLQIMCPELFSVQIETPDYTKRAWSYTLAEVLRTKYAGTLIEDFMTGYAGLFSMETNTAMDIGSIFVFAIVIIISAWKFKASLLAAFTDGYTVLLLLMLEGFISMIIVGFIAFLSTLLGGIILFFNRS